MVGGGEGNEFNTPYTRPLPKLHYFQPRKAKKKKQERMLQNVLNPTYILYVYGNGILWYSSTRYIYEMIAAASFRCAYSTDG